MAFTMRLTPARRAIYGVALVAAAIGVLSLFRGFSVFGVPIIMPPFFFRIGVPTLAFAPGTNWLILAFALMNLLVLLEVFDRLSLKRDLEVAREIQLAMLPDGTWSAPGVEASGLTRPANTVGGDFYDILPRPDGRVIVALGDVAGKASPAALLMALFLAMLRTLVDEPPAAARAGPPAQHPGVEARAAVALHHPVPRPVRSAHRRPRVRQRRPDAAAAAARLGAVEKLATGGIALAMFEQSTYESGRTRLEPGDALVMYSDGITEAESPAGQMFEEFGPRGGGAGHAGRGRGGARPGRVLGRGPPPPGRTAGRRPHRAGAQPADRAAGPDARPGCRKSGSPGRADLASNRRMGRAVLLAGRPVRCGSLPASARPQSACARSRKTCRCCASAADRNGPDVQRPARRGCRSSRSTPTPTPPASSSTRRAARRDPGGGARARSRAARRRAARRRLSADRRGLPRERPARPAVDLAARHPPAGRHGGGGRRHRDAVADRRPRAAVAGGRAASPGPRTASAPYTAHDFVLTSVDFELRLPPGSVFVADTTEGVTGARAARRRPDDLQADAQDRTRPGAALRRRRRRREPRSTRPSCASTPTTSSSTSPNGMLSAGRARRPAVRQGARRSSTRTWPSRSAST